LTDIGRFLAVKARSQLLDAFLNTFEDRLTGVTDPFGGVRDAVEQTLGDILGTLAICGRIVCQFPPSSTSSIGATRAPALFSFTGCIHQ
jgi:hypothetical protein